MAGERPPSRNAPDTGLLDSVVASLGLEAYTPDWKRCSAKINLHLQGAKDVWSSFDTARFVTVAGRNLTTLGAAGTDMRSCIQSDMQSFWRAIIGKSD